MGVLEALGAAEWEGIDASKDDFGASDADDFGKHDWSDDDLGPRDIDDLDS